MGFELRRFVTKIEMRIKTNTHCIDEYKNYINLITINEFVVCKCLSAHQKSAQTLMYCSSQKQLYVLQLCDVCNIFSECMS